MKVIVCLLLIIFISFVSSVVTNNNDNDATTIITKQIPSQQPQLNLKQQKQKHALLFSIPLAGHLNPLIGIGEELVHRGWKVSVATLNEAKSHIEHQTSLISFIDLGNCSLYSSSPNQTAKESAYYSSITSDFGEGSLYMFLYTIRLQPCLYQQLITYFNNYNINHISNPLHFDIIITDFSTTAGLDISRYFHIPVILNNADLLSMISSHTLPVADYIPSLFTTHTLSEMSRKDTYYALLNRCVYTLARIYFHFYITYSLQPFSNDLRSSVLLPPLEYFTQTEGQIILVNGAFPLEYSRYVPPNVILTGAMMSEGQKKIKLHDSEKDWIEKDNRHVMWVSMGTLAPLSESQMSILYESFSLLKQYVKIYWKVSSSQEAYLRSHFNIINEDIQLTQWISSQFAVLQHERTKIFLSHCGINSVYESLYYKTLLLCLPQFFDQRDMAIRVMDSHVGLMLDKHNMSVSDTSSKIESLLNDKSYIHDLNRISDAIKLAGGVNTAANIVEYVEKYGSKEFGTNDAKYSWIAKSNIDVYMMITLIFLIIFFIWYMMLKCMWRIIKFICCCERTKKGAQVHAKDE